MNAKKSVRARAEFKIPENSKGLSATQGMLQLVRTEVKADVRELRSEMKAEFKQIASRFNQADSRFDQTDAKIERVLSVVARVGVLVEGQNSRNQIVMEGLTGLFQRQERVETGFGEVKNLIQLISARSRR